MSNKRTFYNMLKSNAANMPDKVAIVYDTVEVTYKRLYEDVCKKAIHLSNFEGSRIAIFGPASYRWIVNMFGTILAGKDIVLLDFFLPQDIRRKLLDKSKVDYTLTSTNQYILSDSTMIIIPNAEKDDVEGKSYDESVKEGNVVMYTATPHECDKPVVLSTAGILSTVDKVNRLMECDSNDKVLSQIALHHIFGYVYSLIWPLCNGACVCVGRGLRHIDADTYYYNPTILPGTPSMIDYLRKVKGFNGELEKVVIGAAGCPFKLFENLNDRDLKVYNIYGMTEVSGGIGINEDMDGSYVLLEPNDVKISEEGEILVSGSSLMEGYDKDPGYTGMVMKDGIYHTGDYGRLNDEGRLVISERNASIILLPTGETLSKARIDEEVTALSGVAESYTFLYDNKLTSVIVPIDKGEGEDRFRHRIDKYNEKKGYRWEIERIVIKNEIPKLEDGSVNLDKLEDMLTK